MKIILLVSLVMIALCNCDNKKKQESFPDVIHIASDSIKLDEGYSYYHFTHSDKYLVWYESFLSELFIYNVLEDKISKVNVPLGRGPGEVTAVGDMVIINEEIYILNKSQKKIVKYDISMGEFEHVLVYKDDFRYMTNYKDTIYFRGAMKDGILKAWPLNTENIKTVENTDDQGLMLLARNNAFDFDGVTLSNERYILFAKYYKPEIVIYDKINRKLKTVEYDELTTEIVYETNGFGFVSSPPQKVEILISDIDFIPQTNQIAILGKGGSENRVYTNKLHIYDLDKRMFVDEIILNNNEYRYVNIINNNIYIFDNKKNVLYKYNNSL